MSRESFYKYELKPWVKRLQMAFALSAVAIFAHGCLDGDTVDISALSAYDRVLFKQAASIEGVATTTHGEAWDWIVEYDYNMRKSGQTDTNELGLFYCSMKLNPTRMYFCETDSTDHFFRRVSRHELKHCKQGHMKHSNNSESLMFENVPC